MTDLVYLCVMALEDPAVESWRATVQEYHALLAAELGTAVAGGGDSDGYPLSDLMREFKLALLDFHRWQVRVCAPRPF